MVETKQVESEQKIFNANISLTHEGYAEVTCPECGRRYTLKWVKNGRCFQCPFCHSKIIINIKEN